MKITPVVSILYTLDVNILISLFYSHVSPTTEDALKSVYTGGPRLSYIHVTLPLSSKGFYWKIFYSIIYLMVVCLITSLNVVKESRPENSNFVKMQEIEFKVWLIRISMLCHMHSRVRHSIKIRHSEISNVNSKTFSK